MRFPPILTLILFTALVFVSFSGLASAGVVTMDADAPSPIDGSESEKLSDIMLLEQLLRTSSEDIEDTEKVGAGSESPTAQPTAQLSAPVLIEVIPSFTVDEDSIYHLNLNRFFESGDGDITYSFYENTQPVIVELYGNWLVIRTYMKPNWVGDNDNDDISIVIKASNTAGDTYSNTISINVREVNDAPKALSAIPPQSLYSGETITLPLDGYFSDVDSSLSISVADEGRMTASVSGNQLTLQAPYNWDGVTEVYLLASDGMYAVSQRLTVEVLPAPMITYPERTQLHDSDSEYIEFQDMFSQGIADIVVIDHPKGVLVTPTSTGIEIEASSDWKGETSEVILQIKTSDGKVQNIKIVLEYIIKQPMEFLLRNYFLGIFVAVAIIGTRVYTGKGSSRSPVKLENYRHYKPKK